jgi:membrane-bound serine protease (ClpP class)
MSELLQDGRIQIFITLLLAGLLAVGAEIFIPGGIVGTFGVIALFGAVSVAFAYDPTFGIYAAVAVLILLGISLWVWLKVFPKTRIGRSISLETDGKDFKAPSQSADLVGQEGEAHSDLRPSGFAVIGGNKIDVISEGNLIPSGTRIHVLRVEGNRVIVRQIGK